MTPAEPPRSSPRISDAHIRKPLSNGLIIGGIIALFVLSAIGVWAWWSADENSAADNSRDAIVQPAEIPTPRPAVIAQPNNDPTVDATGDAAAGDRTTAPVPAPAAETYP